MDQKLYKLYWDSVTSIEQMSNVITAIRAHNYHRVSLLYGSMARQLQCVVRQLDNIYSVLQDSGLPWGMEYLTGLLCDVLKAQEDGDMILVGDLLKLQMIPSVQDILSAIQGAGIDILSEQCFEDNMVVLKEQNSALYKELMQIEKYQNDDIIYELEPTSSGRFTLALTYQGIKNYLHSNDAPVEEAKTLAERYYQIEKEKYVILGFGLGYLSEALFNIYSDVDLTVMESDLCIVWYALHCKDYSELLKKVRLIYAPNYQNMQQYLDDNTELIIFRPEIRYIRNMELRNQIEHIANRMDSIEDFKCIFAQNFRENVKNCNHYIDELHENIQGKKVIIVAGGPSLDKNINQLKLASEDTIIVVVGTVYKLLLEKGIRIDYVIVSDWKVYPQIQGAEDTGIPIIILSTADRRIARCYHGERYLVCQVGYQKAKEYAEKRQYMCYDSGGSVATLALDIVIQLQAKSIAFIGLDLAYYGDRAHAQGTLETKFAGYEQHPVEGKNGEMLNASQVFIQYRQWMERRIKKSDVECVVYDATEGGTKKEGFIDITLSEYIAM